MLSQAWYAVQTLKIKGAKLRGHDQEIPNNCITSEIQQMYNVIIIYNKV